MNSYSDNESNWSSIADLMTGLMVVFMFILVSYILKYTEYKMVENEIYNQLEDTFNKEIDANIVKISPDGSVRFNPDGSRVLFKYGKESISRGFRKDLDAFIPKYLKILTNKEYFDNIKEIRIEGHTDHTYGGEGDAYEFNLNLSTKRAEEVLKYVRNHQSFKSLPDKVRKKLEFHFTANGMSYSKEINSSDSLIFFATDKRPDLNKSRRVEFRVITSNEKMIEKISSK